MKNTLILWLSLFTLVFLPQVSQAKDSDVMCLAKNIYYEAGSEPLDGKLAVAQVVMNRVADPYFPKTVCDVINQKASVHAKSEWDDNISVCQFSWVCSGRKIINKESDNWKESLMIAKKFLKEDFTYEYINEKVLFFHNKQASFQNKNGFVKVATIGNHNFYMKKIYVANR